MTTTEEIKELAEQKLRKNRVGVRKALKTLHELLHEGETVLNLGSGVYEGQTRARRCDRAEGDLLRKKLRELAAGGLPLLEDQLCPRA